MEFSNLANSSTISQSLVVWKRKKREWWQKMALIFRRKHYLCHPKLTKGHKNTFGTLFAIWMYVRMKSVA